MTIDYRKVAPKPKCTDYPSVAKKVLKSPRYWPGKPEFERLLRDPEHSCIFLEGLPTAWFEASHTSQPCPQLGPDICSRAVLLLLFVTVVESGYFFIMHQACGRILLVEDNPDDLHLALRAFKACAHRAEIVSAGDGHAAIETFREAEESGNRFDLAIVDLQLPKRNGIEVVAEIRRIGSGRFVPIIVLSSSHLESDIRAAYENGANSYLRKPFLLKEFNQMVSEIVSYWCSMNLVPRRGGV